MGAVLLLLWATHFINRSFVKAFGAQLRTLIRNSTSNRVTSFMTGFGVTALLQSSTATTLMTASFIDKNMVGLRAAIAIVIGADLSTTIIAQILVFDLTWLSPALIAVGASLYLRKTLGMKMRSIGNALVALGLVLLSLSLIREISEPLKSSPILLDILHALSTDPTMAILFSGILTLLIHSSLATVLFYAALASHGIINLDLSVYLIIGANIGGALIPYVATYGSGDDKKRLMMTNIGMRLFVALISLPFLPWIQEAIVYFTEDPTRQVVFFHTGYNIVLACIFLPIVPFIATLASQHIKGTEHGKDPRDDSFLDDAYLDRPSLALASAMRETLRMADLILDMTNLMYQALKQNDAELVKMARVSDKTLDKIFKKVILFLTKLERDNLTEAEVQQYERILSFATNLEHSGDIVQHSLSKTIEKKINSKENFSEEGWEEISAFCTDIISNIKTAHSIFISQSVEDAESLIRSKKSLKKGERDSRRKHFVRISENNPDSIGTSGIHTDLIRDLNRINSHITSVAYEVLNTNSPETTG